jgi:hypothetical protein
MKLKFNDYFIEKYIDVGSFSEGLARVKNSEGLWG